MIITAVNAFELFATLSLQTTAFENALKKAQSTATTAGNGIKSGFSGLSDLFTSAGEAIKNGLETAVKTATVAITAASAAVVGLGKKAIDAGMSFDSAMSQVAATMGKTVADMESELATVKLPSGEEFTGNLRDFAKKMGAETKFSATEAAGALNYMALAGYTVKESMEMMPNVLNLAAAGGMQLQKASDMLTDTQKALGLSFERTNLLVDEMAKAASTGNTSVEQLGEAFLTVGGLAKEANGGFVTLADGTQVAVDGVQEMEIAFTAMANAGVKGSEAGTHMRNMLLKLASPTEKGTKAFEEMGISVYDAEGKMRSLKDIFGELNVAFGNMSQADKLAKISDIFNARDTASAEALLAAVEQDWDKIGESILNAEGAAQGMANTQLNNLTGAITIFKSALEGVYIEISEKLTPSLVDFVKIGQETLSNLIPAIKAGDFNSITRTLENAFSQALDKVSTLVPKVLKIAGTLVSTLTKGIARSLPKLGTEIVKSIPGILGTIRKTLQGINGIGTGILSSIADELKKNMPGIARLIGSIIQELAKFISKAIPELIKFRTNIITEIAKTLTKPRNISIMVDAGISLITALVTGLADSVSIIVANAPTIIENIKQGFIDNKDKIKGAAIELWNTFKDNLKSFIKNGIPTIGTTVFNALKAILSFITDGGSDSFVDNIGKSISSIWNAFSNIDFDTLSESFLGAVSSLQPIIEKAGKLVSWLSENVLAPFIEWAGNDILPNLFDGLAAAVDLLSSALDFLKTPALAVWEGFLQPLLGYTGDIVAGTIDLISGAFQGLSDTFSGVDWDGYWLDFENFGENWSVGADDISQSLLDAEDDINEFFNVSKFGKGWNDFWQGIGENVADNVDDISNTFNEFKELFWDFVDAWTSGFDDIINAANDFLGAIAWEPIFDLLAVITGDETLNPEAYATDLERQYQAGLAGHEERRKQREQNKSHFAKGGVVTKPTTALIGEAGDEVVMPLENNTGWISELAQRINTEIVPTVNTNPVINFDKAAEYNVEVNGELKISNLSKTLENIENSLSKIKAVVTPEIKTDGIQSIYDGLNRISETEMIINPVIDNFELSEIPELNPSVSELNPSVRFDEISSPEIPDLFAKVKTAFEITDIPEVSDIVAKVKTVFEEFNVPEVSDISVNANTKFSDFEQPEIADKTAKVNYDYEKPVIPVISDITAKIKSVFESFDLPKIPDIFAKIKTVFEDIKSPVIPDIVSKIKTVFDNFDIPDIPEFEDIKVKIKGIFEGFNVPEIPESKFRVSPDFEIPEIGTLQYTAQNQAVNATSEQPIVINELVVNMENSVSSDYDVDRMSERFIRKLSDRIDTYKYRNRRGVGGTA